MMLELAIVALPFLVGIAMAGLADITEPNWNEESEVQS